MTLQDAAGFLLLLSAGAALAGFAYAFGLWRDTLYPPRKTMAWAMASGLTAHPDDLGWVTAERTFARADGGVTPAWAVQGREPGSPVIAILLHGHGRSRWDSLRRASPWLERSRLVIMPDLRGHGDAQGLTTLGREEPRDLVVLMADLAAEFPGARFTLVGHSLGAVVAIHAAAAAQGHGVQIERVEAFGPYEIVATPFRARISMRGLPVFPWADITLAAMRVVLGRETPTSASARRLAAPLVVHADESDTVSPAEEATAIARAAPHGSLQMSRGVPHADLGASEPPAATRLNLAAASTSQSSPCPPA